MDAPLVPGTMEDCPLGGRVLIGRYQLGERLGCGELGDVYAADDLLRLSIADEADVVVKVFHESLNRSNSVPMLAILALRASRYACHDQSLFLRLNRFHWRLVERNLSTNRSYAQRRMW